MEGGGGAASPKCGAEPPKPNAPGGTTEDQPPYELLSSTSTGVVLSASGSSRGTASGDSGGDGDRTENTSSSPDPVGDGPSDVGESPSADWITLDNGFPPNILLRREVEGRTTDARLGLARA